MDASEGGPGPAGGSDADVIASSLDAPAAFAEVFDRHAASIHRFLARRVEPAEAEGLLGDVFRIAFERRATFDTTYGSARPWLYGIAANLVGRHRRSEARRLRAVATLAGRRSDADHGDDSVGERTADTVDAGRSWAELADAIDALPEAERTTLLLYAWEELSYPEIAAVLGVPVGTVRSRLHRARQRLAAARAIDHCAEEARP
jgi:RNA polymerase sigma-70 factor (ECF subfamily)